MAAYVYGDDAPSTYVGAIADLRAFLRVEDETAIPDHGTPARDVVNAAMSQLRLYRECWTEMARLAEYLCAQYPEVMAAARSGRTVDTVIRLLEQHQPREHPY